MLRLLCLASLALSLPSIGAAPTECGKIDEACAESRCCEDYGYTCKEKELGGWAQCLPVTQKCPPPTATDPERWTCNDLEAQSKLPQLGTVDFALLYDDRFPAKKGEIYMKTPLYMKRHQIMWQQNEVLDFTFLAESSPDTTSVLYEFLDWQRYTISAADGRSPNGDQARPFSAFGKDQAAQTQQFQGGGQKYLGAPNWIHTLEGCGGGYTLRATPYNQFGNGGVSKYFSVKLLPDCGCIDFEPLLKGMELIALNAQGRAIAAPQDAHRRLSGKNTTDDGLVLEEMDKEEEGGTNLRRLELTDMWGEPVPQKGQIFLKHGWTYVIDTNKAWPGQYFTFKGSICKTLNVDTISKVEWILMDEHRERINTEGIGFDQTLPYTMFNDNPDAGTFNPLPAWMIKNGGTFFIRALPYDMQGKPGPEDTAQDLKIIIVPVGGLPPQMSVGHESPQQQHNVQQQHNHGQNEHQHQGQQQGGHQQGGQQQGGHQQGGHQQGGHQQGDHQQGHQQGHQQPPQNQPAQHNMQQNQAQQQQHQQFAAGNMNDGVHGPAPVLGDHNYNQNANGHNQNAQRQGAHVGL